MIIPALSEGFVLGIATGTTCLATCGPIYAPFIVSKGSSLRSGFLVLGQITTGRFVAYAIFGALAGSLGGMLSEELRDYLVIISYLLFSSYLIVSSFQTLKNESGCAAQRWYSPKGNPLVLGFLTGINICPPFLISVTGAIESAGALAGVTYFLAFFLGTTIFLLPLATMGIMGAMRMLRKAARFLAIGVGLWFLARAGILIYDHYKTHAANIADNRPVINLCDSTAAWFLTDDSAPVPKVFTLLQESRKGVLELKSDTTALIDRPYIFMLHATAEKFGWPAALSGPGRFICVLPDSLTQAAPQRVIEFLKYYHFRFDVDSGTVFFVPSSGGMAP